MFESTVWSRPPAESAPSFSNLEEFYQALQSREGLDSEEVSEIKRIFEEQKINIRVLHRLTDEKLREDGIVARSHREAILALIGK